MSARPGEAEAIEAVETLLRNFVVAPMSGAVGWGASTVEMMAAAYPLIARAVAEDIAQQIDAEVLRQSPRVAEAETYELRIQLRATLSGLRHATRIARNYITKEDDRG